MKPPRGFGEKNSKKGYKNMSICPICGAQTSSYMGNERKDKLCRKHANEFKEGKIIQCEKCGTWHNSNESCEKCGGQNNPKNQNREIDISQPNTCLICGDNSNGFHFCKSCFHKLSKKETIIKINNCISSEILDSQYINKDIISEDGHIVKSKDEVRIDDYLYHHKIQHRYEKEYYPNNPKYEEPIKPDWILPDYKDLGDVYIEYWGLENNKKYNQQKEYKMQIYKEDKVTLICLYPEDTTNLSETLEKKLKRCRKGEINE